MGNMMTAAAIKELILVLLKDLKKKKVEEILGLDLTKYRLSVIIPFGYRINEQSSQLKRTT